MQRVIFRSTIPVIPFGFGHYLLWPLVKLKEAFQEVYDRLIDMMWEELMGSEQEYNQLTNVLALFAFLVLSFISYFLQDYEDVILSGLFLIWVCDFLIAKYKYIKERPCDRITITRLKDGRLSWEHRSSTSEEPFRMVFRPAEVKYVTIKQSRCSGGAFQETVGLYWEASLLLNTHSSLLISKKKNLGEAFETARKFGGYFKCPVKFSHSIGNGSLAERHYRSNSETHPYSALKETSDAIVHETHPNCSRIYTKWRFSHMLDFFGPILKQTGFFLFLLILAGVMFRCGEFLNWYLAPYIGVERPNLHIQLSFAAILKFFRPDFDYIDTIEYGVILSIMAFQLLNLMRSKQMTIDRLYIQFDDGGVKKERLNTTELEAPVFISKPIPTLILMDKHRMIEIKNLHTRSDFLTYAANIEQAIDRFRTGTDRREGGVYRNNQQMTM